MSHINHYRVLPWAIGPLTLLESITKVPDQYVAKMGKLSFDFFLSVWISQASTIKMRKKQYKSVGIALTTYMILKKLELVCDSQVTPCLYLALYTILFDHIANYARHKLFTCTLAYSHPLSEALTKCSALLTPRPSAYQKTHVCHVCHAQ